MSRVRSMFGLNKFCSWSMFEGGAGVINMTLTWKNRACGEQYTNPLSQHHPQGTSNLARIQNVVDVASWAGDEMWRNALRNAKEIMDRTWETRPLDQPASFPRISIWANCHRLNLDHKICSYIFRVHLASDKPIYLPRTPPAFSQQRRLVSYVLHEIECLISG